MNYSFLGFGVLLFLANETAWAQGDDPNGIGEVNITIPEVAILDLESTSGTTVNLSINAGNESGTPFDLSQASDSSIWLNYSSVKGRASDAKREIFACFTSGQVPNGLQLRIQALQDAGKGNGVIGTPRNELTLSYTPRKIIKNIGSCYTGTGVGSGHRLVYSLRLKNNRIDKLDYDQSGSLTVLYTFSED